jgi:membrane protein DedA with SNARE-associated domain
MENIQDIITSSSDIPVIGIYALPIIANIFPGIPEEIFLLAVGYLVREGSFSFLGAYAIFFIGFFTVDLALFSISRRGARFAKFMEKKFHAMNINIKTEQIRKHERMIIFISRFIPFMRWMGPVLTGMAHVSYKKFMRSNFVALLVYVPFVLFLGYIFHHQIHLVVEGFNKAGAYISISLIVLFVILSATMGRKFFLQQIKKITR